MHPSNLISIIIKALLYALIWLVIGGAFWYYAIKESTKLWPH